VTDFTPDEIREYCRAWSQRAAAQYRAERLAGGPPRAHQGSPLATICEDLERADFEHLTAVVAGMTVCIVRPSAAFAGYGRDYRLLWAWCAELLIGSGRGGWLVTEPTLDRLFTMACHAALARDVPAEILGVERHARELVNEQAAVIAYLAYPLLEQVVRVSCDRHFGRDGKITQAFDTPGQLSKRHLYAVGGTCSSIGDLLWLYRQHYASPEMRANLDAIDAHLASAVAGGVAGFRVLQLWRNETMHRAAPSPVAGATSLPVIGAAILSMALLIALATREVDFSHAVSRTVKVVASGAGSSRFYPLES
jgi:hypothetical protein